MENDKNNKVKKKVDVYCNCTDCNGPRQVGPCLIEERIEKKSTIRFRKKSNT